MAARGERETMMTAREEKSMAATMKAGGEPATVTRDCVVARDGGKFIAAVTQREREADSDGKRGREASPGIVARHGEETAAAM